MSLNLETIKDTIRKLLNLAADDAATEGEVSNAMRFASRLMEKHHLTEEDLPAVDEKILELDQAEFTKSGSFAGSVNCSLWEARIAMFVCDFVGGVCCYHRKSLYRIKGILQLDQNGKAINKTEYIFYGVAEDVAIANAVFSELIFTIATLARLKYASVYRGSGQSYCLGFVSGLFKKLREVKPLTSVTALMVSRNALIKRKIDLAEKFIKSNGIKLYKHTKRGTISDHDAHSDGKVDGQAYTVGNKRNVKLSGVAGYLN